MLKLAALKAAHKRGRHVKLGPRRLAQLKAAYLVHDPVAHATERVVVERIRAHRAGFHQSFALSAQVLLLLDELSKTPAYSYYGLSDKTLHMLAYLREHCADVTMKSLGREFGYTANYCSQYLRKHTGKAASELIAEARIAKAEGLLATTMGVEDVAAAVGYTSYSHFNELFKLYHDMTPGDYRRLSRIV